jgi:hypothetical protein
MTLAQCCDGAGRRARRAAGGHGFDRQTRSVLAKPSPNHNAFARGRSP